MNVQKKTENEDMTECENMTESSDSIIMIVKLFCFLSLICSIM